MLPEASASAPPGIIILINVAYFPEKKFHF